LRRRIQYSTRLLKQNLTLLYHHITKFEIDVGAKSQDGSFWNELYSSFLIIPFDRNISDEADKITN
ncbi:MAG: hypothetical protein QMB03_12800, partial [Spirosomataceae bacterium]